MSEFDTQPTITTLLEETRKGFAAMAEQFNEVFRRLDSIEANLKKLSKKFDELALDHYEIRGRVAVLEERQETK